MASVVAGRNATDIGAMRRRSFLVGWSLRLASAAFLLGMWASLANLLNARVLPGPLKVLDAITAELADGTLLFHIGMTLMRVSGAFALAMLLGTAIGYAMGRNRILDRALDLWLVVLLNLPALVVIIMAYIWFGMTEAAAIGAAALNKLPNTIVTIREGARALDPQLDEMATSFRFSALKRMKDVVVPQLVPYIAAAARSGLSLVWKIVLMVELLGRSNGVGFQLHFYFQLFQVDYILAYSLSFVAVMLLIELLVTQPLERRANHWRGNNG